MLEKLGLPPKPSLRGNSWVVDASHCQGCSSQFTFINRKHHCRRCGGIFCNSCTQQRMLLRGQGDSPVRICDPCKKLEESARFEMRYGHKSKAAKGGSKSSSKKDDDFLTSLTSAQKTGGSSSNVPEEASLVEGGDIIRNLSLDQQRDMLVDVDSATPEELREQALVEKKKYRTLKAEGKPEEALRAFKRGKELERQAGALEISLRKNRKKALSSNNTDDIQQTGHDKKKLKEKDDLSAELKELGWSDADLHSAEKRPANLTLEGELSSLLREVTKKPDKEKKSVGTDKSQVIVHKKKALELKRAGNLVEAKEELKIAKVLERKIEEEELLGEADDDSDDELSSLIRSMDDDEHNIDLSSRYKSELNFDFSNFVGIADDLAVDGDFEVTDADMDDPQIANALKSLGWTEESTAYTGDFDSNGASSKRESMQTEIQSLKREALAQKRAGNTVEAMTLLKKAKLLETEIEKDPSEEIVNQTGPKLAPKSKYVLQKELIALKKTVFSLKREGRLDESEEELKKAKVLEQQLEDMNKAPTVSQPSTNEILGEEEDEEVTDQDLHDPAYLSVLKNFGWEDEDNVKVPSTIPKENNSAASTCMSESSTQSRKSKSEIQRELLALKRKARNLRREGETEEADEVLKMTKLLEQQLQELEEPTSRSEDSSEFNIKRNASMDSPPNAKSSLEVDPDDIVREIDKPNTVQQEILAHKRKAVAFKREGKLAEAKEELRQAKLLEKRMEDTPKSTTKSTDASASSISSAEKDSPSSVTKPLSSRDRFKLQQESLSHKRQALKLRREGKAAEADAEFELAKALESQLQELDSPDSAGPVDDVGVEDFLDPQLLSALQSIGLEDGQSRNQVNERPTSSRFNADSTDDANRQREQLMEQIKSEKVKAVHLKRSGKQAEALDALRRAKLYEKKLQSLTSK